MPSLEITDRYFPVLNLRREQIENANSNISRSSDLLHQPDVERRGWYQEQFLFAEAKAFYY